VKDACVKDGCSNSWMDGLIDVWIDGCMDGWRH